MISRSMTLICAVVLILGAWGLKACTPDATPEPKIENVDVKIEAPEKIPSRTENIPVDNCSGPSRVVKSLSMMITDTNVIEIGVTASVVYSRDTEKLTVGKIIPLPMDVQNQLQLAVEAKYRAEIEKTITRVDSLELPADPNTSVEYEITWSDLIYKSTIDFSMGEGVFEVPYSYKIQIPDLTDTVQIPCDTPKEAVASIQQIEKLPNGKEASAETIAELVGGNAKYWTKRASGIWRYWNQGYSVTFHHPGGNSVLSYWAGFPAPENAEDCLAREINQTTGKERYLKCPNGTQAEFQADGVGFHLTDDTGYFK